MKEENIYIIIIIILIALFMLFIYLETPNLVRKQEIAECHEWQRQAREFKYFRSTDWQKEQCDHYDIKLIK